MKVQVILTNEDRVKYTDITSNSANANNNVKDLFINPSLNKDVLYSISFVFTYSEIIVFSFKMWEMEAFQSSNEWYKLYNGEDTMMFLTPKQNVELKIKSVDGIVTFISCFKMDNITSSFQIPLEQFKPFIKNYIDCHKMINEYWDNINKA